MNTPAVRWKLNMEIFLLLFLIVINIDRCRTVRVTRVTPNRGSRNGGTLLSISGSGFSSDQFTSSGNTIRLQSEDNEQDSHECDFFQQQSNAVTLMCYTRPMPEGTYVLKLTENGVNVEDICTYWSCKFRVYNSYTPTITKVIPTSGPPGQLLRLEGKIFTDVHGSNTATASNGRDVRIKKAFAGFGILCKLTDPNTDELYGLALNSETSVNGHMLCLPEGTSIDNKILSYMLDGEYGLSLADLSTYHVSANDVLYMHQSYAEVLSVSPSEGSTEGELDVMISGRNFDESRYTLKAEVLIDGEVCKVKGVSPDLINCTTPAKPSTNPGVFAGNRGLLWEYWTGVSKSCSNLAEISNLNSSHAGYNKTNLGDAYFIENDYNNYVSRMRGFFVPPKPGRYSFHIKGDDCAILYLSTDDDPSNKVEVATLPSVSSNYNRESQSSDKKLLLPGRSYYFEIVHREGSGGSNIYLAASFYDTTFINSQTENVIQEEQKVMIATDVTWETQNVTFAITETSKTDEVQQVFITPGSSTPQDEPFRFRLYDASTVPLNLLSTDDDVKSAIKGLPVFESDEDLTVSSSSYNDNGKQYTITFISERGDWQNLGVVYAAGAFQHVVSQQTEGKPSGTKVALIFDGVPSSLFSPTDSASKVENAMKDLFSARCPSFLTNPSGSSKKYNYEPESTKPSFTSGSLTADVEAFCGRGSIQNLRYLYDREDTSGILLSTYKHICFAHQGKLQQYIKLKYFYDDDQGEEVSVTKTFSHVLSYDVNNKEKWYYTCMNMYDKIKEVFEQASSTVPVGLRLDRVELVEEAGEIYFIDVTVIVNKQPTSDFDNIHLYRMPPPRPGNALINLPIVRKENGVYSIELRTSNCGNNLPQFQVSSGQIPSGSTATIVRHHAASLPVGGKFDLSYKGVTKTGINYDVTASDLKNLIELTFPDIGAVSVEREGDCANFHWKITFETAAGDQPEFQVGSGTLSGSNVQINVVEEESGRLFYDPIPSELVKTLHDDPQVTVKINGIPSKCSGDCTFRWTEDQTPTVTSVSPSVEENLLQSVIITGTGFDTTEANNKVMIGPDSESQCTVTSATATTINCTLGSAPLGKHKVDVIVSGKGRASHPNGVVEFEYTYSIDNLSPTVTSLGGGPMLSITGRSFSPDAVVTVGGRPCEDLTVTSVLITCTLPENPAGLQTVQVIQSGQAANASTEINYDDSITKKISSVSPTSSVPIEGGQTLELHGSGFGTNGSLMIGNVAVDTLTFTDTLVTAELPPLPGGTHKIKLYIESSGFAVLSSNNQVPTVVYNTKVTNVFPQKGSLHGGTRLTMTGEGFSTNTSNTEVKVGNHICNIESANSTHIVCIIKDTGMVHSVDNSGTHYVHNEGFAWNPKIIRIKVGDTVHWSWEYPSYVSDIKPRIEQNRDENAVTYIGNGGFRSSAEGVKNGQYMHKFTTTGTYYYWSGYVNSHQTVWFRGSVEVEALNSNIQNVSLIIAGFEAEYDTSSGVADPSDSSSCPGTVSSCTDASLDSGSGDTFTFSFLNCSTPVITSFEPANGTTDTVIQIGGSGFDTTDCNNEVTVGGAECTVQSSTESTINCKINPSSALSVGTPHVVALRVGNIGYGRLAIIGDMERTFGLFPLVKSLSPMKGSLGGQTQLTITGSGFDGSVSDTIVEIDGFPCTVTAVTYTKIVCTTPQLSAGSKSLTVKVRSIPAQVCNSCQFEYSNDVTPTISSVTPQTVTGNGSTEISVSGTNLQNAGGGSGRKKRSASGTTVKVGGEDCPVSSASDTEVICTLTFVPCGSQDVEVWVDGKGKATSSGNVNQITSESTILSSMPSTGSLHGGTVLQITGNGFIDGQTTVTIDGSACSIIAVSLSQISCLTAAHAAGSVNAVVAVTSAGCQSFPAQTFEYATSATPVVSSINPTEESTGQPVTITGDKFSTNNADNKVTIGGIDCDVTYSDVTSIQCTLGAKVAGTYGVLVDVSGKGLSNNDIMFTYSMTATGVNPSSGSIAGGQVVTIQGSGFENDMTVTICGETCVRSMTIASSPTAFVCETPEAVGTVNPTLDCDVIATVDSVSKTISAGYTYNVTLTPEVTSINPTRGGTGGGTSLTINGSGFGTDKAAASVKLAGRECDIDTISDNQIVCTTNTSTQSVTDKVKVHIGDQGIAKTDVEFQYIDVWSSLFTWGGVQLPQDGDLITIQRGQVVLLDTITAKLKMLLIQGELIFDEKDVELHADNILVSDGGRLQVGTEDQPFQHKATIMLHGHPKTKGLPVFGTKSLGVRNGTLDLHGKPVPVTWTLLAQTVSPGSNTIVLQQPVTWQSGDQIVIATTGHRTSQHESEVKTIQTVASDNVTLTLTETLTYTHLGVTETVCNGQTVELRAEVGLLTHNVVVRGSRDPAWDETVEACPQAFNPGEFATQTCFQGRFGEEITTDEFGSQIMVHAPEKDSQLAVARLAYIEITHAGQAFRLGRYPVHFHLNGDMSKSYVRGCSIHQTFNRAINVHDTRNVIIEGNVVYKVKGGALFLEDGIETNITLQYNLAVFVIASSSLLNDDVTPAAFWLTNPNNQVLHNHAAGCTFFAFWYRMRKNPEGPSFTTSICPRLEIFGVFYNNTAHSNGWFGLWIFETYTPKVGGACGQSIAQTVVFENLIAWNNDKGAEIVNSGAIQAHNFILLHNKLAGYEMKLLIDGEKFTQNSALIGNSCIVGHTTHLNSLCTRAAIVLPYRDGFSVQNVTFENFNQETCWVYEFTRIQGTCSVNCGGFWYLTVGLIFISSPNKLHYVWPYEGIIRDLDGSLTGEVNGVVLPTSGILPTTCTNFAAIKGGIPASKCPSSFNSIRFSWNGINPDSLDYKDAIFTNQYGNSSVPWKKKRITHPKGWMISLPIGQEYDLIFDNAPSLTNISYSGRFNRLTESTSLVLKTPLDKHPDQLKLNGVKIAELNTTLDASTCYHLDWNYDDSTNLLSYCVSGRVRGSRKKRSANTEQDVDVRLEAVRCYYKDCKTPVSRGTVGPVTGRPDDFYRWSQASSWVDTSSADEAPRNGGINMDNSNNKPVDGESVTIREDEWMVADELLPVMPKLILRGTLELDPDFDGDGLNYLNFEIRVTYLLIFGGRLIIGWPDSPFLGTASIILQGNESAPYLENELDDPVSSKSMIVGGGLELHGKQITTTWTRLAQTANVGSNNIVLENAVDWKVNDEIVIAPTGYKMWEAETFKITAISANRKELTLNGSMAFNHTACSETLSSGQSYSVPAEVGHFSRNIKIFGDPYPNMERDSYGARVNVGMTSVNGKTFTGYGRISNVEFYNCGHEGYVDAFDPRFCLSFTNLGQVSAENPSYVKDSTFHNAYSPALGIYGTNGMVVENNVVYHTVWFCLETTSDNTTIKNNLFVLNIWDGAYLNRYESNNLRWQGCIEGLEATNLNLLDNAVAGAERLAYHVVPQDCTTPLSDLYLNNLARASLVGAGIFPIERIPSTMTCAMYSGFTAVKCPYYGIYYNNKASVIIDRATTIECGIGIFQMVIGPGAVSHVAAERTADVQNSLIIGTTSCFDCNTDVLDATDDNIELSGLGRPFTARNGGKVGVSMASFQGGSNKAPEKPLSGIKTYPTILGEQRIHDSTFAHFSTVCGSKDDIAISTSKSNDDGMHPLNIWNTTADSTVNSNNKVFYHRPNLGKINSADCVDMDCDGMKKALVKDKDGSFLGTPSAIIPHSEWEWNGDRRRGLGDYRVPIQMQTRLNGERIPMSELAPHKGIIGVASCENHTDLWHAYKCDVTNYHMLIIESLDDDTETRRVSPVAILGNGYLDLINGPQDHGWCSGYTCRKRVSTFMAIVKTNEEYLIHFTGTEPEKLRFYLLTDDSDDAVIVKVWYEKPRQRSVYVNGAFVMNTNGYYNEHGTFLSRPPPQDDPDKYLPNITAHDNGANYFDRDEHLFYVLLKGENPATIETQPSIIVSFMFPAQSVDEFFGEQVVMNLCSFFDLPFSKCKLVEIVSASQARRRRKRSTQNDAVVVSVSDNPPLESNTTVADALTDDTINNITDQLIIKGQTGTLGDITNTSEPVGFGVGYDILVQVHSLCFAEDPNPQYEVLPFQTQPKIRACDDQGQPISILGTEQSPWILTASLRDGSGSNSAANLTGNQTIQFVDGWANFTDLALSQSGSGFVIEFKIISPPEAVNFSIDSSALTINARPIKAVVVTMATDVVENETIPVLVELRDELTDEVIEDLGWRGHMWMLTTELGSQSPENGLLTGTTNATFDSMTAQANLSHILSSLGMYLVKLRIQSMPAEYDITVEVLVTVKTQGQASMIIEDSKSMTMKFDQDYNLIVGTGTTYNQFLTWIANYLMLLYKDVLVKNIAVSSGSIIVTFTVDGSTSSVNTTIYAVCSTIENGQSLTYNGNSLTLSAYLNVDGSTYYGVSCGPSSSSSSSTGSSFPLAAIIAVSVIVGLLLIGAIIFLILWKCKVVPKSKTHDIGKAKYFGDENDPIEDILFREKTFMSIRSQVPVSPVPPLATIVEDTKRGYREEHIHSRGSTKGSVRSPPPAYSTVIRVATPVTKPIWKP